MLLYVAFALIVAWYLYRCQTPGNSAVVSVLGDIGRSPRMQNHISSLVEKGFQVEVIGYSGSAPLTALLHNPQVRFHYLSIPKKLNASSRVGYLLGAMIRVFTQTLSIVYILLVIPKPRFMMIQNPPAIPSLVIFQAVALFRGVHLVIDWHNFGYSIMAISGVSSTVVKLAEIYEKWFGKYASLHITVTKAMKETIQKWPIHGKAVVLYDRPPSSFRIFDESEKNAFLGEIDFENTELGKCAFRDNIFASASLKSDRPALLISSTSWTEDEDFSILLHALELYEAEYTKEYPKLVCIVTGKGPMKQEYVARIERLGLKQVKIHTAWLDPEDYPKILACADVGISLHSSSSGLDLPMKVVDMFGVGLPVLALNFHWYHWFNVV
jgi:beta-1,4-mannosyltransferase